MSVAARTIHGFNKCIIPHPENAYRPLALRHKPLAAVSALLLIAKLVAISAIALTPAQARLSTITTNRMIQLTNQARTAEGLDPLRKNNRLMAAAKAKGRHMLENEYFAHISPSGVTPWFWMRQEGYSYRVAGENLAIDFTEAEDVVDAWLASPGHRENLLKSEYTETGMAVVAGQFEGDRSIIVVHMFGLPASAASPQQQPAASTAGTQSKSTPTPEPDPAAPGAPELAIKQSTVGTHVRVEISGQPGTTAYVLVGNSVVGSAPVPPTGTARLAADLSGIEDGDVTLRAYLVSSEDVRSAQSPPVTVTKDTQGPPIPHDQPRIFPNPAFDTRSAAVTLPSGSYESARAISEGKEVASSDGKNMLALPSLTSFTIEYTDNAGNTSSTDEIAALPQFEIAATDQPFEAPAKVSRFTRQLTISIAAVVAALVLLAILIRIRVQHPALIAHGSAVVLLAIALLII